jgi:hypothetical protein
LLDFAKRLDGGGFGSTLAALLSATTSAPPRQQIGTAAPTAASDSVMDDVEREAIRAERLDPNTPPWWH